MRFTNGLPTSNINDYIKKKKTKYIFTFLLILQYYINKHINNRT